MPIQAQQPVSIDDLLKIAGQGQLGSVPKLQRPEQQGYAPGGPQINYLGGSSYPVNETPAMVQNALVLFQELLKAAQKTRVGGQAGGPPTGPAQPQQQAGIPGFPQGYPGGPLRTGGY